MNVSEHGTVECFEIHGCNCAECLHAYRAAYESMRFHMAKLEAEYEMQGVHAVQPAPQVSAAPTGNAGELLQAFMAQFEDLYLRLFQSFGAERYEILKDLMHSTALHHVERYRAQPDMASKG